MAGLAPQNLRLVDPVDSEAMSDLADIIVQIDESGGDDTPVFDSSGNVVEIEHGDGSVTVSLDGKPIEQAEDQKTAGWFDNLVDKIDDQERSRIADDLLRSIGDDITSRQNWIDDRANGIKLLGLKLEIPGIGGSPDGAPVEGMSRVRHPLLLEAVLRFQANARSELLPTDGPVKIRDDNTNDTLQEDKLANALEKDLNHYLTATASEYYPDTDRMLFMLGFGGTAFKKVYFCPLRNRPVSETVDADDLIVNNSATDLRNARRVTHRTRLRPSVIKRLQILGVYRDIDLHAPRAIERDSVQVEKDEQQGLTPTSMNPEDRDREIYETCCELDIKGFEHKINGKETGLEIPYRVTIDVSSREILSIVRNYAEDEQDLPEARELFVKYTFVPGMGFYDIGLLAILGNTTLAVTAAWREMLDAGMFANFPGFLITKSGTRQNSMIARVAPGSGFPVETDGMPINQAIMPLPYKDPSASLMSLVDNIATTGMRVGGTAEQAVGEGKADAPVGTTLALIDQATKILNAVHKRMHAAQAYEFQLLVRCFREHPESFWQRNKKPTAPWDETTFIQALDNCDLVPQADPNTASMTQRFMKVQAVKQMQGLSPTLYDPIAVETWALNAIGISNPDSLLVPTSALGKPTPEMQKQAAEAQAQTTTANARMLDAQTKAAQAQQDDGNGQKMQIEALKAATDAKQADFQQQRAQIEDDNRDKDRAADLKMEQDRLRIEQMRDHNQMGHESAMQAHDHAHDMTKHATGLAADAFHAAQKPKPPAPGKK